MEKQLESALRYLDDSASITLAYIEYSKKTNSAAATVGLLRVRELINIVLQLIIKADTQKPCRCCSLNAGDNFCANCGRDLRAA